VVVRVPRIWEAAHVFGTAHLVGHQGGWDEALMVLTPVAIFWGLFRVASHRAEERHDGDGPTAS
jgi:hypothetical protein